MLLNAHASARSSVVDSGVIFLRDPEYSWTLTSEYAVGANSLPTTISGSDSAKSARETPEHKIVMSLDHSRRFRKPWIDFGGSINSGVSAPPSSFVWNSASSPYFFNEEKWLYNDLFLEERLSNIWSNREREGIFHPLVISDTIGEVKLKEIPKELQRELYQFSMGNKDVRPDSLVVQSAERLVRAALRYCNEPEIALDIDGELSFDLRLVDNRLILAELALDGSIDASVYDGENKLLERMPHTNESQFLTVLKS